jgi:phosphoglycolate phosphatase
MHNSEAADFPYPLKRQMSQQRLMHPVDLLIFDLDGTIVDTGQDLSNAVNFARKNVGLPAMTLAEVMHNVGDGMRKLLERSLGAEHHERIEFAIERFREFYGEHLLDCTVLYPGIRDVLEHYKEKKLAILSNKPVRFTEKIVNGLQIDTFFDRILGGDSLTTMKPSPEPIKHLLTTLDVAPTRCVIIGDGTTDIESGKRANVYTCAVTYGFRDRDVLHSVSPDYMINDIRDLMQLFE